LAVADLNSMEQRPLNSRQGPLARCTTVVSSKFEKLNSIGDVVKFRIAEVEFEAEEIKRYVAG